VEELVPKYRIIPVKNLDGTFGKLNTARCRTVQGYGARAYYLAEFLHKTTNKRWYIEEYNPSSDRGQGREVTLDQAAEWCLEHTYTALHELNIIKELTDVSESEVPRHGGDIVVKCLSCLKREKRLPTSRKGSKRAKILDVLKRPPAGVIAKGRGLLGKEIAVLAGLKYDSGVRGILAELTASGVAVKTISFMGYMLARDQYRRKKS
jgi:hypothetical protein